MAYLEIIQKLLSLPQDLLQIRLRLQDDQKPVCKEEGVLVNTSFHIEHVVRVAKRHPFYSPNHEYPLTPAEISEIVRTPTTSNDIAFQLSQVPLTEKKTLYEAIQRLSSDKNPKNTFRHGTYISTTGGGSGTSAPMAFWTDIQENRAQRQACGRLMRRLGVLNEKDCVLSMHTSGYLYRALDLMTEMIEYTGASVLTAGHLCAPSDLLEMCHGFNVNVLTADASQLLLFANYVEATDTASSLNITKIMYTSETLTRNQRQYLARIFRSPQFSSVMGSAEMGCWPVANLSLTGEQQDDCADFIFDERDMVVEVLPMDVDAGMYPCDLSNREMKGILAVTSLQRLRHPLLRYLIGDIGSVHDLPASTAKHIMGDVSSLKVLRLYGRDLRGSFEWQGEYFSFSKLKKLFSEEDWGVLRWQILLEKSEEYHGSVKLEVRVILDGDAKKEAVMTKLRWLFVVHERNEGCFRVKFLEPDGEEGFVKSGTGRKVLVFVDRR